MGKRDVIQMKTYKLEDIVLPVRFKLDKITLKLRIRGRRCFIFDNVVVFEHLLIQSIKNGRSLLSYTWSTVDLTVTFSQ